MIIGKNRCKDFYEIKMSESKFGVDMDLNGGVYQHIKLKLLSLFGLKLYGFKEKL